jgi:hypothetical protein
VKEASRKSFESYPGAARKRCLHKMTGGHYDSLVISVIETGRVRHSDDDDRAISLTYPAYPVSDKRHEVFFTTLSEIPTSKRE